MRTLQLNPKWGSDRSRLQRFWNSIGNVDRFKWFVRADMQEQLAMAHAALGMNHIRAIGMLSSYLKVWQYSPVDAKLP